MSTEEEATDVVSRQESEGFIREVIFDWALKISAISKVARKGKGMAQKGSSIREAQKHRMWIVWPC